MRRAAATATARAWNELVHSEALGAIGLIQGAVRAADEDDLDHDEALRRIAEVCTVAERRLRARSDHMLGVSPASDPFDTLLSVSQRRSPHIRFSMCRDHGARDLPVPERDVLIGAVREAILNAERHARPREVTVTVTTTPRRWRAVVRDDGLGTPAATIPGSRGIRRHIIDPVRSAGGTAEIGPGLDGRGTRWVLELPTRRTPRVRR